MTAPAGPTSNILQVASARRPSVRAAGRVVSVLVIVLGSISLVGRAFGLGSGPVSSLGALPLAAAVAKVLIGTALWDLLGRARVAVWLAATALAIGIGLLVIETAGVTALGQRVAVASGVIIVLAGLALVTMALSLSLAAAHLILGTIGIVLLSLAVTIAFARVFGVLDLNTERQIAATSYQMLGASALVGGFLVAVVVSSEPDTTQAPPWLAWGAGVGVATVVLILWLSLAAREREQVLAQTRLAAEAERLALLRELESTSRSLERLADQMAAGAKPEEFRERFGVLLADQPGLTGGVWLPPTDSAPVPVPADLNVDELDRAFVRALGDSVRGEVVSHVALDPEPNRVAVIATACGPQGCGGAVVGVLDAPALFRAALADSSGGFRFGIEGRSGPVSASAVPAPALERWREDVSLAIGGASWRVVAWPTVSALRRLRSDLPATVLFMGLLVAGLLPVTLRLGQLARERAEQVAKGRVSAALDRATDGVWELDLATGLATRSRTLWQYLRYERPPSAVGDAWFSLIHPEDADRVERALERHLEGETEEFEAEYRIRAGDDSWHTIVDRGRVVDRDAAGRPRLVMGISADVTEVQAAAAQRAVSENRFRAAFDSGIDAQLLLDREGRVLEMNRAAASMGGADASEAIGQACPAVLWWARHPEAAARLREAIARGATGQVDRFLTQLEAAPGGASVVEWVLTPVADHCGEIHQLLLDGRDETIRRRAEQALQEVSTLTTMGRLAARVAHEINNPLAGIQSAFMLVKDSVPAEHPHHRYVASIEREIGRIAGVTRQLYETYRPETESTPEASVATLVTDGATLLEQLNKRTGIRISVALDGVPAVVPLPSAMIRQIVFNLVQNAIDASPEGAVVSVRATAVDDRLTIVVRDSGPGVPDAIKQRIFEPFFSTKQRSTETGGMGLGLSLVHRSVTAVGGRITVRDADGGGAEFVVELPLDRQGGMS
ncbi:MAG: ATP-binding protein [Gemmatimonadales bacterium]